MTKIVIISATEGTLDGKTFQIRGPRFFMNGRYLPAAVNVEVRAAIAAFNAAPKAKRTRKPKSISAAPADAKRSLTDIAAEQADKAVKKARAPRKLKMSLAGTGPMLTVA